METENKTNAGLAIAPKPENPFAGKPEMLKALLSAQQNYEKAKLSGKNPHHNSVYATHEDVLDAIKKPLNDAGIFITHKLRETEKGFKLDTFLIHAETSQHCDISSPLIGTGTMQNLGSAITYAKRYNLTALSGIATEDDDGNAAAASAQRGNQQNNNRQNQTNNRSQGNTQTQNQQQNNNKKSDPPGLDPKDKLPEDTKTPEQIEHENAVLDMFAVAKEHNVKPATVQSAMKTNFNISETSKLSKTQMAIIISAIKAGDIK